MGNSASTPGATPTKESNNESTGQPHKSLRVKKRSLELPDLASLALTPASPYARARHSTPPKSACIPIPHAVNSGEPRTRPQNNLSTTEMLVSEPSTHIPFPPPSRGTTNPPLPNGSHNHYFRGAQSLRGYRTPSRMAHQRLQELYNQSNDLPVPPPSSLNSDPLDPSASRYHTFIPEVVHSSIPIGLLKGPTTDDPASPKASLDDNELQPIKITWRGGGKSVVLARAGDNGWKGRQLMERESSTVYSSIVWLPRGTHHFRFLVDDQWRVADDLPTAVDDQGTLANYVAVRLSYSPPKPSNAIASSLTQRHIPGQSFWSAASSADGDVPEPPRQLHHHSSSLGHHAVWTSEIPQELIEAAREEEAYLQASAGQYEANNSKGGGTTYVSGFVPAPNIPPAPGLPRHLDKLILNTKMSTSSAAATPGIDPSNTPPLTDDASVLPVPSHVVLHHLCTSAIRNGVLAVANTIRYRGKYLTTAYYKPT
ncbi:5'-AMP-activated protein kinase beta subunit, interation domain-containing protein [Amanita rubescens]|nr:5'-AMP-activated protein kinase beta subunit, interation domain-containing protein [Amanita rubescens]